MLTCDIHSIGFSNEDEQPNESERVCKINDWKSLNNNCHFTCGWDTEGNTESIIITEYTGKSPIDTLEISSVINQVVPNDFVRRKVSISEECQNSLTVMGTNVIFR